MVSTENVTSSPQKVETTSSTPSATNQTSIDSNPSKSNSSTFKTANTTVAEDAVNKNEKESKTGLRKLLSFGKKKKDDSKDRESKADSSSNVSQKKSDSSKAHPANLNLSQKPSSSHPYLAQSPTLRGTQSSSPRLVSPAGSQIFERDVQESTATTVPASPAIPAHIQTENHIPAVLSASTEAITDAQLSPDAVEIVMHSSHQPAIAAVTGLHAGSESRPNDPDEALAHGDDELSSSTYTAMDSSDVRRLSFISFADVVQSEQAEHARDPMSNSFHVAGLTAIPSPSQQRHRSPSPIRSVGSSQGIGSSPPTSKSASVKGLEMGSPARIGRPLASPTLSFQGSGAGQGPELMVETMSQTLKKSRSGELLGSGTRSVPLSPVGPPSEPKFP